MLSTIAFGLLAVTAIGADAAPSPTTISVFPRKLSRSSPGSSSRRRAVDPVNLPLTDLYLNGTDLQWYGNISVGTPPQVLTVLFDTGSDTLEFSSVECTTCVGETALFDGSKSSTYTNGGKTSTITFGSGTGVDPVVGDNWTLDLLSGSDVVSVGGVSAGTVSLFTVTHQTTEFDIDPFTGILGLGPVSENFFAGLENSGLASLFSFYLTSEKNGNAELTLGGIDTSKYTGDLIYSDLTSGATYWTLDSTGISINGQTTALLGTSRSIIFDTGTSNVMFDTDIAEDIYAGISADIVPYAAEPGAYGIDCSKIASLPAVLDVGFKTTAGEAFNLTIPSAELNLGPFPGQTTTCQTLINAVDGYNLLGASLLKHYYTVFDVGNQKMGFASNDPGICI
ncbi:acid protease [Athelia psychrophila]|uniref:Acid protease n=1 Tax=Athelia psychrophila TaxID=1759441 RepID=A0A167WD48_9AGAM|nr:acid protease [Fibularhizoctonia sp. CBS 109695]